MLPRVPSRVAFTGHNKPAIRVLLGGRSTSINSSSLKCIADVQQASGGYMLFCCLDFLRGKSSLTLSALLIDTRFILLCFQDAVKSGHSNRTAIGRYCVPHQV